ncbi:hypothetical protein Tco_0653545 [Tanacetum coccineum]|uniref:Reverse transcriptase domain-containing protein n=1 Tax=Tanacetum coccineum TaxID=301880 RepID=A0ABQ4X0Q3_9ASTR
MSSVLQERGFGSLPSSTKTNPKDQYKSISTTIEADLHSIRRIGSSQYVVSTGQNNTLLYKSRKTTVPFPSRLDNHYCEEEQGNYGPKFTKAYRASHINNTIPRKEKDPGSFPLPCFINDVCFDNALVDLGASVSVMPFSTYLNLGLSELAHTSLRERMELDLEARLMGETLVLNRSLDPFLEDYIELNDLNEPFELRRNQGDDLIPTIKEGEVIEEFRTRDEDLDTGIDDYPFLEDMDAYRDEGMGDIIVGEPFLREVRIKAKHFEGIITLYNGDDEVTYQMVRSHTRFKNHTNEQCNKIPPLLPLLKDLVKEISTNIGGEFTNLEILKCWSLKTSRRCPTRKSCLKRQLGESTERISEALKASMIDSFALAMLLRLVLDAGLFVLA